MNFPQAGCTVKVTKQKQLLVIEEKDSSAIAEAFGVQADQLSPVADIADPVPALQAASSKPFSSRKTVAPQRPYRGVYSRAITRASGRPGRANGQIHSCGTPQLAPAKKM